ncbi:MAG: hypothetical protein AAF577_04835 [Pseudomonadota bacterium]
MRRFEETPERLVMIEWRPVETLAAVLIVLMLVGVVAMTALGTAGPIFAGLMGICIVVPALMLRNLVLRRRLMIDRTGRYVYASTLALTGRREQAFPLAPDSHFEFEEKSTLTKDGFSTPDILQLVTGPRRNAVFDRPERAGGSALAERLNGWLGKRVAAQSPTASATPDGAAGGNRATDRHDA